MTCIADLNDLYAAAASIAAGVAPVELVSVNDPEGDFLDATIRDLWIAVRDNDPVHWTELLAAARQLRWRRVTEPYPARYGPRREEVVAAVIDFATRRKLVANQETRRILDELSEYAAAAGRADNPVGELLLQSIEEVGYADCLVVLATARAAEGARYWFHDLGLPVAIVGGRGIARPRVREQAYLAGPPPIFGVSALTAPRARAMSYVFPSWIADRRLPESAIADLAVGAIRPHARLHSVGGERAVRNPAQVPGDQLAPSPVWTRPAGAGARAERADEVVARKVLLAGGRSMWLDQDGGWIRTLDPFQPAGERVLMHDEQTIRPGVFLVLREGETESEALYARSLALLGDAAGEVEASQQEWKDALDGRLRALGQQHVVELLGRRGVRAARRAPFWLVRTVARPRSDADFVTLLEWLGLEPGRFVQHANRLRRARSQAAADVREALENALDGADLVRLERDGHMRLDLELEGFAAITAARVLAVSPFQEVVPRNTVRIPTEDRDARWLE